MKMNDLEYREKALSFLNPNLESARNKTELAADLRIIEGVMGLNSEAGEALDILKKWLFQGHDLDTAKLIDELGDVLWYLNLAVSFLGLDISELMEMNIKKLETRYGERFSVDKSVNRDEN